MSNPHSTTPPPKPRVQLRIADFYVLIAVQALHVLIWCRKPDNGLLGFILVTIFLSWGLAVLAGQRLFNKYPRVLVLCGLMAVMLIPLNLNYSRLYSSSEKRRMVTRLHQEIPALSILREVSDAERERFSMDLSVYSNLGPGTAEAQCQDPLHDKKNPVSGYLIKIVKGDPSEKDCAVLVYPAEYDSRHTLTFACDLHGIKFEQDFGPDTHQVISKMERFDASKWKSSPLYGR